MALKALFQGQELLSSSLSNNEWADVKSKSIVSPDILRTLCCNKVAYCRSSKYGVRHFVHKEKGDCECSSNESWQHSYLKTKVAKSLQELGFDVTIEAVNNDWRADVLAEANGKRFAYEIQLTHQSFSIIKERHLRYLEDNVRCCWIGDQYPRDFDDPQFPWFIVEHKDFGFYVGTIPVELFIKFLWNKRVKFCQVKKTQRYQVVNIGFHKVACCECKNKFLIYESDPDGRMLLSVCGDTIFDHEQKVENLLVQRVVEFARNEGVTLGRFAIPHITQCGIGGVLGFCYYYCPFCSTTYSERRRCSQCSIEFWDKAIVDYCTMKFVIDTKESITYSDPHWCIAQDKELKMPESILCE